MLELRGQRPVSRHNSPTVTHGSHTPPAAIEHRLDRENHPLTQGEARPRLSEVPNLRFLVHLPADAVTAIFTHHGIAVAPGMSFDRPADVSEPRARANRPDAHPHRLIGGLDQPFGGRIHLANEIGLAGICDVTVLLERDVEIDDVAVAKHVRLRWNAVADHIVHRRIQHETIAILALACGSGLEIVDDEPLDHFIHLKRREAGERAAIQQRRRRTPAAARLRPARPVPPGRFVMLHRQPAAEPKRLRS